MTTEKIKGCGRELQKPYMDGSLRFCGEFNELCNDCLNKQKQNNTSHLEDKRISIADHIEKVKFEDFFDENEQFYLEQDLKQALQILKTKWKEKCKRMDIMSGDVAVIELNLLLEEVMGKSLTGGNDERT